MKLVFVVSLFLSASLVSCVQVKEIYEKYAVTKFTEMCFGKEKLAAYTAKMYSKIVACSLKPDPKPAETAIPFFRMSGQDNENEESQRPIFDWTKLFGSNSKGNFIPIAVPMSAEQAASLFNPIQKKTKRSAQTPFYDQNKVRSLKNRVAENIKSFTCMMEGLNYIDANGNLVPETFKTDIRDFKLNKDLETDLLAGLDLCIASSASPVLSKIPTTFSAKVHQQSVFFECVKEQRKRACLKDDLRSSAQRFDLSGLDGTLAHLSDADKMLAVVWADIQFDPIGFLSVTY